MESRSPVQLKVAADSIDDDEHEETMIELHTGPEQDNDNDWPPLQPKVYNMSQAKRSSSNDTVAPKLCKGCRALRIYNQLLRPPPSEQVVDTKAHQGLQSFSNLRQSAATCDCCKFIMTEMERELSLTELSSHEDTDLDALELRCYVTANDDMPGDRGIFFGLYALEGELSRVEASASLSVVLVRAESPHLPFAQRLWFQHPNMNDTAICDTIRLWLTDCQEHAKCQSQTPQPLPARYIDVGSPGDDTVRLCEHSGGVTGHYLALSYCWGGYDGCITTSQTYELHKAGLLIDSMPQTYRDMVWLARALGTRHIWIDALCIIQDSRDDWELQSINMAPVYNNALMTVCASNATKASEGFLRAMLPSHVFCGTVDDGSSGYAAYLTTSLPEELADMHSNINGYLRDAPLSNRAWCVQERLLAPRKLHFSFSRMIWECQTKTTADSGEESGPQPSAVTTGSWDNTFLQWQAIVSAYSLSKLTNSSDRFAALSGVADFIARRNEHIYLAGHWLHQLPITLLWFSATPGTRPIDAYRAPSWSWMSTEGGVLFYHYIDRAKLVSHVTDYGMVPTGKNIYGELKHAWLEIRGPMIRARFDEQQIAQREPDYTGAQHVDITLYLEKGQIVRECGVKLTMISRSQLHDVHILLISHDTYSQRSSSQHPLNFVGLVLHRDPSEMKEGPVAYRRSGIVHFTNDLSIADNHQICTVRLV